MSVLLWKPRGTAWSHLVKRVWSRCRAHGVLDHSAALSFYFLLSIFPLLVLAMSIAGSLIHSAPDSRDALRTTLEEILPRTAITVVDSTLDEIELHGGGAGVWIAGLLAAWSAVRGTRALVARLNVAYETVGKRSGLRRALLSLALTLGMLVLLVATSAALLYGGRLGGRAEEVVGAWAPPAWWALTRAMLLVYAILVFGVLYAVAPSVPGRRRRWLSIGAVVGVGLWVAGSEGFRLWLRHSRDYSLAYGSVAAIIALQLWLYLTAAALLIGAEVNAEVESLQAPRAPA